MESIDLLKHHLGDTPRYNHSMGVFNLVVDLIERSIRVFSDDLKVDILTSALLHDIGYSKENTYHEAHTINGQNLLAKRRYPIVVQRVCLLHSFGEYLVEGIWRDRLTWMRESLTPREKLVIDIVSYADRMIGPNGDIMTPLERYEEITTRHANNVKVLEFEELLKPKVRELILDMELYLFGKQITSTDLIP